MAEMRSANPLSAKTVAIPYPADGLQFLARGGKAIAATEFGSDEPITRGGAAVYNLTGVGAAGGGVALPDGLSITTTSPLPEGALAFGALFRAEGTCEVVVTGEGRIAGGEARVRQRASLFVERLTPVNGQQPQQPSSSSKRGEG